MKNIENTFYIKSNLGKKILLSVLAVFLMLCAGFFVFSSVEKTAKAEDHFYGANREFYYAEEAYYSPWFTVSSNLTYANNSSGGVLEMGCLFTVTQDTYDMMSTRDFIVCYGRKAEMDLLAYSFSNGSTDGDPAFYFNSTILYNYGLLDSAYYDGRDAGTLFEELPAHTTFPYSAYRVSQSEVGTYAGRLCFELSIPWFEGNLYDVGVFIIFQHDVILGLDDTDLMGYYTMSDIVSTVQDRVSHASSYDRAEVCAYEKALGIYSGDADAITAVSCSYFVMIPGHFNKYRTVTDSFNIFSVYVPDEDYVRNVVLSRHNGSLASFDVRYTSEVPVLDRYQASVDDLYVETFGSRIIRETFGFIYSYEGGSIPYEVSCDVDYSDYSYKDFFIKLANVGDPTNSEIEGYFANNLEVCIYPTSVDDTTQPGYVHLYFDYQKIFDMFGDTFNWTIVGDDLVLYLDIVGWDNPIELPVDGYSSDYCRIRSETTPFGNKRLDVCVRRGYEGDLFGIELFGTVPIGETVEFDCYIEYQELSNDFSLSEYKTFYAGKCWSNRLGDLAAIALSCNTTLPVNLYDAVSPESLNGIEFVKPVALVSRAETVDWENRTRTFRVRYEYVTGVILITDNKDFINKVYELPLSEADYSLKLLGVTVDIPSGWRVKSFDCNELYITHEDKANALNTRFSLSLVYDKSVPRTIFLELTDEWPITINYLEQWKNSPFAVMKEKTVSLRVADYPYDENGDLILSSAEIATLLGNNVVLQFLEIAVKIDQVNISYDEDDDKYIVDLTYTTLSMLTRDYSGTADEIKIALTPFSMWCEYYGKDWSIMFLNNSEHRYFDYSNDVAPDKLYGFFSYVVFKDEVNDFSKWIREYTSEGVSVVFSKSEVKGSDFYKFIQDMSGVITLAGGTAGLMFGHPIIGAAVGGVTWYNLSSIAEHFNEDNGSYYTYFFFLDGTTDMPWATDSGAEDREDDDSGLKNRVENIGEAVGDFFSSVWDKVKNSKVVKVITIVGAVILGVIVLSLVIKLIMIIFRKK